MEIKGSNVKILLCVIFALFILTPSPYTGAFSECHSDKKGYCVRLESQEAPQAAQKNFASLLFATSHGPPFPGLEFLDTYGIGFCSKIGTTLSALYNFGVVIAGVSTLIIFTFGGILYVTSAGSTAQIGRAKGYMYNALFGLALIAGSYLILYTINHDFVNTLSDKTIPSLNIEAPPPAC